MTVAAGGDGACHKYFLWGMVHKTKHKSPLNFEVDERRGVERQRCSSACLFSNIELDWLLVLVSLKGILNTRPTFYLTSNFLHWLDGFS